MPRLFAALPVPDEETNRLARLQRDLAGAHWRPPENFHITLCFYGDVRHELAYEIDSLLGLIEFPVFDIVLEGMGWFGRREPSAVWARVRESDELRALASLCTAAARRLNLPVDRHPYTPHVTLAYLSGTRPEDAAAWCAALGGWRAGPFTARVFHLYSSRPGPGASRYVPEADYPLADIRGGFADPRETY